MFVVFYVYLEYDSILIMFLRLCPDDGPLDRNVRHQHLNNNKGLKLTHPDLLFFPHFSSSSYIYIYIYIYIYLRKNMEKTRDPNMQAYYFNVVSMLIF